MRVSWPMAVTPREWSSCTASSDHPGAGPEHASPKDRGRARYETVTDTEALDALVLLSRKEGIIPALESAHALACALREAPRLSRNRLIVVNISGRGDKDMKTVAAETGVEL